MLATRVVPCRAPLRPACLLVAATLSLLTSVSAQPADGCRYLIIAADQYVDALQPLSEWKTAKGVAAAIVPLSVTGSTPTAVRAFIRNAWNNWPLKPEFVLIAASPAQLPGYDYDNDCYYGDMSGDYLMEIPVGRFPAENMVECVTMVNRTLAYELLSDSADSAWTLKGTTIANEEDTLYPDPYYLPDCRFVHSLWQAAGYSHIDSLSNLAGHHSGHVVQALNDGRAFITYRGLAGGGWTWPFWFFWPDSSWHNHRRLPVIVSATCATMSVAPEEEMLGNAAMRCGTPESLVGPIAFFGTTRLASACSHFRSACYRGFFKALFAESVPTIGAATLRGRYRVDSLYRDQFHYEEWALFGDPELGVWTGLPSRITVAHDTVITTGARTLAVAVQHQGAPVPGARVCLWLDSTVYAIDTTDAAGMAELAISPAHAGQLNVTVTGLNLRPYRGTCRVLFAGGPFVLYQKHVVNDSPPGGNGDGCVSPGETIVLPLWVQNYGDSVARNVSGRLASADTFCRVLDSVRFFGTIPGRDSGSTGPAGFRFLVSAGCPDGRLLRFSLRCADSLGSNWVSAFSIAVGAPLLEFCDTIITDSLGNRNNRPDPEETCSVVVGLRNSGFGPARDVVARLRCPDPRLTVLDSIGTIGDIPSWNVRSNLADPFQLVTSRLVPETRITCSLHVAAAGASRTFSLPITFGRLSGTDPLRDGPREPPLYWAYDDGDTLWPEHPVFDWVETRGRGFRLNVGLNNNDTVFLPAAFGPFIYYGQRCTVLTVSAHGWVAPGLTGYRSALNVRLPKNSGPPLLAVNWDGFRPDSGNGVWCWHDTLGRRFVIEWDSLHYVNPASRWDRFQLVIHDTTRAARDGASVFDFQYATASGFTSATLGIQDQSGTIGITCIHDTSRHRATMPICPGRAIRFTTNPPIVGLAEPSGPPLNIRHSPLATLLPNPCRGRALLHFASPPTEPVLIRIYDAAGILRHSTLVTRRSSLATRHSPLPLDLSSFPAGIYFVRLTNPLGTHHSTPDTQSFPPLKLILAP